MKSLVKLLATVLFGAALAGTPILAQTVTIDYDHSVNFLKFKTYTWAKVHADDPSVEGRITLALDRDMAGRYMSQASMGGDVTVTAVESSDKAGYASFYNEISHFNWQRGWGSGGLTDTISSLDSIPAGTLVIDMYDTKSHKILWRGTIEEPASNGLMNVIKADKAVTTLIGKYPPKFSK
jgi:hypothetical protein